MTDFTYVGLDLSLTGAGIAVLAPEREIQTTTIKSDPSKYGKSLAARSQRLTDHHNAIVRAVAPMDQQLEGRELFVLVEAPSFASQNGSQHERAGLWWAVVGYFAAFGGKVVEVPPATLKKFATGAGNSDKDKMAWVTAREFPQITVVPNNNEVDALWLATMGRYKADPDLAGVPVTVYRTAAIKAVAW